MQDTEFVSKITEKIDLELKNMLKKQPRYLQVGRKYGHILGIKVSVTSKSALLSDIEFKINNNDKFYIVTPNPENLLLATHDQLLKKVVRMSDFSIPDGVGLSQAYKFLSFEDKKTFFRPVRIIYQGLVVGLATIFNRKYLEEALPTIKGRELFLDILEIADRKNFKVYLFGGEYGEQVKSKQILEQKFKNITFQTRDKFPQYNRNAQPSSEEDRKLHKSILGSIKLFDPDLIIVALNTPKQEKWIYRNFFKFNAVGAMAFGGAFNYIAGNMKTPPKWMEKMGLEWVYRFVQEPKRLRRILNAFPIFPWKVFMYKLSLPLRSKFFKK